MNTIATTPASVAFVAQVTTFAATERLRDAESFLTQFAGLEYEHITAQMDRLHQQAKQRMQSCITDDEASVVMADFNAMMVTLLQRQELKNVLYRAALGLSSQYINDPREAVLRALEQLIEELRR